MSQPTACVLIIGNEILSGKTQDANIQFLGFELAKLGIRLEEARVVRDVPEAIVRHLNECRAAFTYVFTTGGIGPTHDDITAECVALAFGVELVLDPEAVDLLKRGGRPLNEVGRAQSSVGCCSVRVEIDQEPDLARRTLRCSARRRPCRSRRALYSRMRSSRCARSSSANSRKICLPSESSNRSP